MNLLAIDTSSNACSVALQFDGEIHDEHVVEPREHTRILMPMIMRLLGSRAPAELDAVVLGNGPGSFIGMRIGASVAQGICHAAGLPIIPVSSLAAVAAEVFAECQGDRVVVAQDARMHEIYFCCYSKQRDGLPEALSEEKISAVGQLSVQGPSLAAGAAWGRYPELAAANRGVLSGVVPFEFPRARFLLRLAEARGKPIPPEALVPAYLRSQVAEKPESSP